MENDVSYLFKKVREISVKVYFQWLVKMDILGQFTKPETIPSVFYNLNYPSSDHEVYEEIFRFLEDFNIVKEGGGTYILNKSLDKLNDKYEIDEDYSKEPIYAFLQYGLSLLQDRLEGGTGYWDLDSKNYLFERGYLQITNDIFKGSLDEFIDVEKFVPNGKKIDVAVYGLYPDDIIVYLYRLFPSLSNITVITPNSELKSKFITVYEISLDVKKIPIEIKVETEIDDSENFDILFVPNGLGFYHKMSDQFKLFKKFLTKNGYLIFRSTSRVSNMSGVEPLLTLHRFSHTIPKDDDFERKLKSNGFSTLRYLEPYGILAYAQREDKIV